MKLWRRCRVHGGSPSFPAFNQVNAHLIVLKRMNDGASRVEVEQNNPIASINFYNMIMIKGIKRSRVPVFSSAFVHISGASFMFVLYIFVVSAVSYDMTFVLMLYIFSGIKRMYVDACTSLYQGPPI